MQQQEPLIQQGSHVQESATLSEPASPSEPAAPSGLHLQGPQLLAVAAAATLERIREDKQRSPAQLRPLLDYLETHLFDAGLDVKHAKKACGIRDNTLPLCFHHALSLPPYAYIEDCRMEVGCNLLRDTDLKIWQVAQLLGYSTLQVFSRAFKRWSGVRPSEFRNRAADMPSVSLSALVRTAEGMLEKHEADRLARHLARIYPESFSPVNTPLQ